MEADILHLKSKRRERRSLASRAAWMDRYKFCLEVELERKLHDSPTVLIDDLAEVVFSGLIVIEATERIANTVNSSTISIRHIVSLHLANCAEG